MYSLTGYGHMISDRVRYEPYSEALKRAVRPGSVVLEIGTGPGIFAVQACRLGASRVFAIEPDAVIQVAREIAQANGCADKIEFIEDLSTRITLPTKADVIISDLRGILPLFQQHLPSIIDARRRFLAPGGALIPNRDAIWAAIVEAPKQYTGIVDPWKSNDVDLSPAVELVLNDCQKTRLSPEQLLTPPLLWTALDYRTLENADVHASLEFSVERPGIGHGFIMWFDSCLMDGISFSNAPSKPEAIYGSMFFPWSEPVSLSEGQQVQIDIAANLRETDYLWTWNTRIQQLGGGGSGKVFQQSQLKAAIISPLKLRRSASDFIPQLKEDGILSRRALQLMDGNSSLEQISKQLTLEFPGKFPRWQQALSFVARVSDANSF